MEELFNEINEISEITNPKITKLSSKYFKFLPKDDCEFMALCDQLMKKNEWYLFVLVTLWIKKRKTVYKKEYLKYYQEWLEDHINSWGRCDIFCYRCLNPLIENNPDLFEYVLQWAESKKIYVRRASSVCLLKSQGTFTVNLPFENVKAVVDKLIDDKHHHIQKGIGWLLKYAYLSYPTETVSYLKENINKMSRTTFRYGLEKMPLELKNELMKM